MSTLIIEKYNHNHACGTTAASLKYMDLSMESQEKLKDLLLAGYSPAAAHRAFQDEALLEHPDDYSRIAADRSKVPSASYCYNFFYKMFRKQYGSLGGDAASDYALLQRRLEEWCLESGGRALATIHNGDIILLIVTPLMERVHKKIIQAEELMFLDASGHCDRMNHRIYLMYTHSVAGGLPLGYIITGSGKQTTFEEALKQYCSLQGETVYFFGRGVSIGPKNIITDNDLSERNSLSIVWPHSNLLLCTIHVLRSVWRWLLEKKNDVPKHYRQHLFFSFKRILSAKSIEDVLDLYNNLCDSEAANQNRAFCNYVNSVWWPIKECWCLAYRQNLLIRGNNTNNYVEYAVRALKDIVLKRTKAYNIVQLTDLIISRFDSYYCQRLTDFANGRFSLSQLKKYLPDAKNVTSDRIIASENGNFIIKNGPDKEDYMVDPHLGICTCFIGLSGALCKHQSAVILTTANVDFCSPVVYSKQIRQTIFFVASGKSASETWFNDLHDKENECERSSTAMQNFTEAEVENDGPSNSTGGCTTISGLGIDTHKSNLFHMPNEVPTASNFNSQPLRNTFENILTRIEQNPAPSLIKATETFQSNYNKYCRNDHALESALNVFGRYSGLKLSSATSIGVQPTARGRRQVQLQGKHRIISGRPPKSILRDEHMHTYNRQKYYNLPLKRRHCLEEDISKNVIS